MRPILQTFLLIFFVAGSQQLRAQSLDVKPKDKAGVFDLTVSAEERTDLQVNIATAYGNTLYEEKTPQFSGEYRKELDMSKLKNGVYFVRIIAGEKRIVRKILLEK